MTTGSCDNDKMTDMLTSINQTPLSRGKSGEKGYKMDYDLEIRKSITAEVMGELNYCKDENIIKFMLPIIHKHVISLPFTGASGYIPDDDNMGLTPLAEYTAGIHPITSFTGGNWWFVPGGFKNIFVLMHKPRCAEIWHKPPMEYVPNDGYPGNTWAVYYSYTPLSDSCNLKSVIHKGDGWYGLSPWTRDDGLVSSSPDDFMGTDGVEPFNFPLYLDFPLMDGWEKPTVWTRPDLIDLVSASYLWHLAGQPRIAAPIGIVDREGGVKYWPKDNFVLGVVVSAE